MICSRCQRTLRTGEGLKCGACESRYHFKCIGESNKDHRDSGDRGYHWQCALCKKSATKIQMNKNSKEYHELMNALNSVSEKIEVVNKIQLPKFYSDLAYVRTVTEHITKQNEDILRKIEEIESKIKRSKAETFTQYTEHHLMSKNLATKSINTEDINERYPIPSGTKKTIWYRTHRRSYLLHRVLRILNNRKPTAKRYRK